MALVDSTIQKEFFDKISQNDVNGIKNVLSYKDFKTEIYDENGMTPLQHAAFRGNTEIVRLLLDQGANVNSGKHEYGYTSLHFAALSGNTEICQLLLENGAKTNATNSVGRTPSQMAAFVGNHTCVAFINNFVTKADIEYYVASSQFEEELKNSPHLLNALHMFVIQVNLHPVRIAINLKKSAPLYNNIDKIREVLQLMSEREMRRGFETNEIVAFKFHYHGCILAEISIYKKSQSSDKQDKEKDEAMKEKSGKKLEATELFIKKMLKINKGPSPEFQDYFLKDCIRQFPYKECTIFRQMISTLIRKESPPPLSVIVSAINGQRGFIDSDLMCATCGEEKANKKCSKCKSVQYCDRDCQKLHWFVHKNSCNELAFMLDKNSEVTDEKTKQETIDGATEALMSAIGNMAVK